VAFSIFSSENSPTILCHKFVASSFPFSGLSIISSIFSAKSSASAGSAKNPSSWLIISGMPPVFVATTGNPANPASSNV